MNTQLLLTMIRTRRWAHERFGLSLDQLERMLWEDVGDYYAMAGGAYKMERGDIWAELPPILGICPAGMLALEN